MKWRHVKWCYDRLSSVTFAIFLFLFWSVVSTVAILSKPAGVVELTLIVIVMILIANSLVPQKKSLPAVPQKTSSFGPMQPASLPRPTARNAPPFPGNPMMIGMVQGMVMSSNLTLKDWRQLYAMGAAILDERGYRLNDFYRIQVMPYGDRRFDCDVKAEAKVWNQ